MVIAIIAKEHEKRNTEKKQEENEIKIDPDKNKNVTHSNYSNIKII